MIWLEIYLLVGVIIGGFIALITPSEALFTKDHEGRSLEAIYRTHPAILKLALFLSGVILWGKWVVMGQIKITKKDVTGSKPVEGDKK